MPTYPKKQQPETAGHDVVVFGANEGRGANPVHRLIDGRLLGRIGRRGNGKASPCEKEGTGQ
jgi:hypothetical protein